MKLFLDTADIEEIREIAGWGILSGVTTNPSLMAQAGRSDYKAVTQEICYLVQGPINAEVVSLNVDGMVAEAEKIATWSPYVVVKIPTIEEGIKTLSRIRRLEVDLEHLCEGCPKLGECDTGIDKGREIASRQGIRTNATLIFSATQALLAMIAGASYVSTFVGRLDNAGQDGMQVIADIAQILRNYDFHAENLVASVRHVGHLLEAAKLGADIATVPYGVIKEALAHPMTDLGLQGFLADWAKVAPTG
jgi:transaldolase